MSSMRAALDGAVKHHFREERSTCVPGGLLCCLPLARVSPCAKELTLLSANLVKVNCDGHTSEDSRLLGPAWSYMNDYEFYWQPDT